MDRRIFNLFSREIFQMRFGVQNGEVVTFWSDKSKTLDILLCTVHPSLEIVVVIIVVMVSLVVQNMSSPAKRLGSYRTLRKKKNKGNGPR